MLCCEFFYILALNFLSSVRLVLYYHEASFLYSWDQQIAISTPYITNLNLARTLKIPIK